MRFLLVFSLFVSELKAVAEQISLCFIVVSLQYLYDLFTLLELILGELESLPILAGFLQELVGLSLKLGYLFEGFS